MLKILYLEFEWLSTSDDSSVYISIYAMIYLCMCTEVQDQSYKDTSSIFDV